VKPTEKLGKREIKDIEKLTVRTNEMFSKGFTNLAIRDELSVYFPEITEENVQELREKWERKQATDREMMKEIKEKETVHSVEKKQRTRQQIL